MAQRDEQWSGVLQSINVSLSVSQAATLRQMEKVELEIKASTLRFDQMERTLASSLECISESLETPRPATRSRAK